MDPTMVSSGHSATETVVSWNTYISRERGELLPLQLFVLPPVPGSRWRNGSQAERHCLRGKIVSGLLQFCAEVVQ